MADASSQPEPAGPPGDVTDPVPTNGDLSALTQPVQFLKGIGPQRARWLAKLGIRTGADLLFHFPRRYEDYRESAPIESLVEGERAMVAGEIVDIDQRISYSGKHLFQILVGQGTEYLKGIWFNQAFLVDRCRMGQRVVLQGKAQKKGGRWQMSHPRIRWPDDPVDGSPESLIPVYPLVAGIHQRQVRAAIAAAVAELADQVPEALPESDRQAAGVIGIAEAIRQIHAPRDPDAAETARDRLVFQELLVLQLALALRKHRVCTRSRATPMPLTPQIRSRIVRRLPFELTPSQNAALDAIAADLDRPHPMNRLLHGEVGSGKTVIAVCTLLVAVANGHQGALMAPTEILARQHLRTLDAMLRGSRVRTTLLTGSLSAAERRAANEAIANGETDLVVGTQAILSRETRFPRLGLVVIDEQHKFGVRQRAALRQPDHDPHYLVMTATPIPRTVSMTLFGDLDVSVLEKPPGVGNTVHTYLGQADSEADWWDFVQKKLREGRQAYVVAPLVDGDEDSRLASAERLFEGLANGPLEAFRIDLLHGRQSAAEKEIAMERFASGETQVLVATGVIEVGINVPNATVMTILSAERFGLSQLHQLRGRISRGAHPGYVCAFATDADPSEQERLQAFESTTSGFELAEIDLQLRGPGDLFSTHQSGFPPLKIADLMRDGRWLRLAQREARRMVQEDPELAAPERQRLRSLVLARYGDALELGDVG